MSRPRPNDADPIVREVRVAAPPHEVFAYFTDPARMVAWKAVAAWLEPVPGGLFRIDVNGRRVARGEFLEIDPPRRVVFSWGWEDGEFPPGSTRVEITLSEVAGGTLVRLVHSGLPAPHRAGNAAGWDHYLERLRLAAGGADPGPDPRG